MATGPARGPGTGDGFAGREGRTADLLRMNLRWSDFYLLLFEDGPEGTEWRAIPIKAPDEALAAESALTLTELLIVDHGKRQEAERQEGQRAVRAKQVARAAARADAGADAADKMST
jgi:hypothetical protein